jgi:hypothetical protein
VFVILVLIFVHLFFFQVHFIGNVSREIIYWKFGPGIGFMESALKKEIKVFFALLLVTMHSAASNQHLNLNSQHPKALSTQYTALSVEHSAPSILNTALSNQHSAPKTQQPCGT